jgi:hypothetical protein
LRDGPADILVDAVSATGMPDVTGKVILNDWLTRVKGM